MLEREVFHTPLEMQVLSEQHRQTYNRIRPHSSLGHRPPAPETFLPTNLVPVLVGLTYKVAQPLEQVMRAKCSNLQTTTWSNPCSPPVASAIICWNPPLGCSLGRRTRRLFRGLRLRLRGSPPSHASGSGGPRRLGTVGLGTSHRSLPGRGSYSASSCLPGHSGVAGARLRWRRSLGAVRQSQPGLGSLSDWKSGRKVVSVG